MPLTTCKDFLELSIKQLTDHLSVLDLNSSGRKVELIARASAAMELKPDIIQSSKAKVTYYKIYNIFENNVWSGLYLVGFSSRKWFEQ